MIEICIRICEHRCDDAPPRPGRVTLANTRQIDMSQFGLRFALPAPGAPDVTTRELSVTVNSGPNPVIVPVIGAALESEEAIFNDGDLLAVVLVDIDGHGNRSQPSAVFTYTVTDTVSPPTPGDLGVSNVRQIDEPTTPP